MMNTQDKMLLILLITVLMFTATVIVFNALGLQVQDSLINMFLGACTGELVTMGGIKIFKTKNGDSNKDADKQMQDPEVINYKESE